MNRLLLFALLIVILQPIHAQKADILQGKLVSKNFVEVIPFDWIKNKVIVEAEIGGVKRKFFVDSGAPFAISQDLQDQLNFPVLTRKQLTDVNQNKNMTDFVTVNEVKLGNVRLEGVPAMVIKDQSPVLACFGIDGFIGSSLMHHFIVQIDLQKKEMTMTDKLKKLGLKKKNGSKIMVEPNQASPIITINLNDRVKEELLLDTGDDGLYALCRKNYSLFKEKGVLENSIVAKGYGSSEIGLLGAGEHNEQMLLKFTTMSLAGATITNVIAELTEDDNSRIGAILFTFGKVVIDYPGERFFFLPENELNAETVSNYGMDLTYDGKLRIGTVWEGTKAHKAGLKPGLEVVAIDRFVIADMDLCELVTELNTRKMPKKVKLVYLSESGEHKKLELEKVIW